MSLRTTYFRMASMLSIGALAALHSPVVADHFEPTTAEVNVQVRDVMLLSNIAATNSANSDLSAEANLLWTTRAGLDDFASNYSLGYQVNTSALINGVGDADSLGTNPSLSNFSEFPDDGFCVTTSTGSGDTFATGDADLTTPFDAAIHSFASAGESNIDAIATGNAFSSVLQLTLASAAEIAAINGGSSVFTLELYADAITAMIDLFTDDVIGAVARGEFDIIGSITARNEAGAVVGFASDAVARLITVSNGESFTIDFASAGPDLSEPFVELEVDAATVATVTVNFGVTSTARAIVGDVNPIPEPSGLAMAGIAGLASAFGVWKKRRTQPVATA